MLLFHDNHQWTADMLPPFLRELKLRGYHVVHMVAGPGPGDRGRAAGLGVGDRAGRRRDEAAVRRRLAQGAGRSDPGQARAARIRRFKYERRPEGRRR